MSVSEVDELPAPAWAEAIKARRKACELSQAQVVATSQDVLYQTEYSRLERGLIHPVQGLSAEKLAALLTALDWTPEAFEAATGLELPALSFVPPEARGLLNPYRPTVRIPVFGSVGAGIRSVESHASPEEYRVFDLSELPKGVPPGRLVLLHVNGDSMYAENLPRPVPHGSMVLVEVGAVPAERSLVVAWISRLEIGVLKQFSSHEIIPGLEPDVYYLRSYKPGGPSFWSGDYPTTIFGVVRRVTYEP